MAPYLIRQTLLPEYNVSGMAFPAWQNCLSIIIAACAHGCKGKRLHRPYASFSSIVHTASTWRMYAVRIGWACAVFPWLHGASGPIAGLEDPGVPFSRSSLFSLAAGPVPCARPPACASQAGGFWGICTKSPRLPCFGNRGLLLCKGKLGIAPFRCSAAEPPAHAGPIALRLYQSKIMSVSTMRPLR